MGNDNTSKAIYATHFENSNFWIGGIDTPVKHYKNGALINSYNTGNARTIISNKEDLLYVGSASGLIEINKISNTSRNLKVKRLKISIRYTLYFTIITTNVFGLGTIGAFQVQSRLRKIQFNQRRVKF